jgi:HSP20 family molecular chaperone IbpA
MVIPENAQASLENGVLPIDLRKYKKKAYKEFVLKIRQSKD